jgi:hypothetical protein
MPFRYRDEGLEELIVESNIDDTSSDHLYRLVFESLYQNNKLLTLFETVLGVSPTLSKSHTDLYLECVRLRREIRGLLHSHQLLKRRYPLTLHRLDEITLVALI